MRKLPPHISGAQWEQDFMECTKRYFKYTYNINTSVKYKRII